MKTPPWSKPPSRFTCCAAAPPAGIYFRRADLPGDLAPSAEVLRTVIGSGQPLNIDGLGGGSPLSAKIAMLSPSLRDDCDVNCFFAQISAEDRLVDFKPTCGNILAGGGPAAVEMGLVAARDPETRGASIAPTPARGSTPCCPPGGAMRYDGDAAIDGVPGAAAPVALTFRDVVGSSCGALLPSGAAPERIDGVEVTCIDMTMPMVIARAADLGLSGHETPAELDANAPLPARLEAIRLEAGRRMGMGDVAASVTPKLGLLSAARAGGTVAARYFTPWTCHPSMAVSGCQCIAACLLTPGTAAEGLRLPPPGPPAHIEGEHPSGEMAVIVDYETGAEGITLRAAGLVRTARLLARGELFVPGEIWSR